MTECINVYLATQPIVRSFAVVRCPSVCHVDVSKRQIFAIKLFQFSSPGGPIILVFQKGKFIWIQNSFWLWNSDGVTFNRGAK